jgi:hypothetical protein
MSFKIVILTLLFVTIGGCSSISFTKLDFPQRNLTEYVFPVPVEKAEEVVKNLEVHRLFKGSIDTYRITGYRLLDSIFSIPANKRDAIYWACAFDSSSLYYNKDGPIRYNSHFHIHLVSLKDSCTKVVVKAFDSYLYKPTYLGGKGLVHGDLAYHSVQVEPTSIEEYQILLVIGDKLGMRDKMPALILPNSPKRE